MSVDRAPEAEGEATTEAVTTGTCQVPRGGVLRPRPGRVERPAGADLVEQPLDAPLQLGRQGRDRDLAEELFDACHRHIDHPGPARAAFTLIWFTLAG